MKHLGVNHLLGIKTLSKDDINLIFTFADSFKEVLHRPIKKVPTLKGHNSCRNDICVDLVQNVQRKLHIQFFSYFSRNSK